MDLTTLLASEPSDGWLSNWSASRDLLKRFSPSNREARELVNSFHAALTNGDIYTAIRMLVIGLMADRDRFLDAVQRKGLLRPSKYDFEPRCTVAVVDALMQSALLPELRDRDRSYFISIQHLSSVSSRVRALRANILEHFASGKESTIKGMLVLVDFLFLKAAWFGLTHGGHANVSTDFDFFTFEEYAEGLSFAVHLYWENYGPLTDFPAIDFSRVADGHYLSLLHQAAQIRKFFEIEILVDVFQYDLVGDDAHTLSLQASDPTLDRAIRLGYIQSEIQHFANVMRHASPNVASIRLAGEKLCSVCSDDCIQLRSDPERYSFGIPAIPGIWDLVQSTDLFWEEAVSLAGAERSLMHPATSLLDLKLRGDVTLGHLLRAQRIFNFIRWYGATFLMRLLSEQPQKTESVLQSLVPCFPVCEIRNLLSEVIPDERIKDVIELLTCQPGENSIIDIQYQPFLRIGENIVVALNVLGGTNLLRNALQLTRRRVFEDGAGDPVSALLQEALSRHTQSVASNKRFVYQGMQGEIDNAARLGGILFVFEDKNPLIPTGTHELRTSWDYVQKASQQLSTIRAHFGDPEFRLVLENAFGFSLDGVHELYTGIVMSNRMFYGYRHDGHPVRGLFEFLQFLEEGTVSMGDESYSYWAGNEMRPEDLVAYLRDDITLKHQWEAMRSYERRLVLGDIAIRQQRHTLSMKQMAKSLGFARATEVIEELECQEKEMEASQG